MDHLSIWIWTIDYLSEYIACSTLGFIGNLFRIKLCRRGVQTVPNRLQQFVNLVYWANENLHDEVDFTKKNHLFLLSGYVNKKNCRIWNSENSYVILQNDYSACELGWSGSSDITKLTCARTTACHNSDAAPVLIKFCQNNQRRRSRSARGLPIKSTTIPLIAPSS